MRPEIDAKTYAREKAAVDAAKETFRRLAPVVYEKGGVIPLEVTESPEWRAVDNDMRGRVEQYEILTNPPERLTAYVGNPTREQKDATNIAAARRHPVTVWTGLPIGTCYLGSGWRVDSYVGTRMYQAHATIAGREYTGRTFGPGMYINLRETAASKRARAIAAQAESV